MQDDRSGRIKRLWVIIGVAAIGLLMVMAVGAIGSRRVDAEVSRIRAAAADAVVDPVSIVEAAYGSSPDPIADALGTDARELTQQDGLQWCAWIEVNRLASTRSLYFEIEANGDVVEVERC